MLLYFPISHPSHPSNITRRDNKLPELTFLKLIRLKGENPMTVNNYYNIRVFANPLLSALPILYRCHPRLESRDALHFIQVILPQISNSLESKFFLFLLLMQTNEYPPFCRYLRTNLCKTNDNAMGEVIVYSL